MFYSSIFCSLAVFLFLQCCFAEDTLLETSFNEVAYQNIPWRGNICDANKLIKIFPELDEIAFDSITNRSETVNNLREILDRDGLLMMHWWKPLVR